VSFCLGWIEQQQAALRPRNPQYYKNFHFQKIKSFLAIQKWTKINVQNGSVQKALTDKKFRLEKLFLWSQMKP